MSAIGALLLADADRLARTASVAAAMSVEALLGTDVAFAAAYQLARPHPGQVAVAAELRHLLRDSALQTGHHGHAHKVQDPYSLRCVPQVHGAVRDTLDHLRRVLDIELNSATDNPLVFPGGGIADEATIATGGGRVISGGNFHGEPIALALDFAKIALAELGSISERRTALLVDPRLNGGLPPFLAAESGIDSGMMIYQYTAAALVSENKVLAHPASVDSIPTSANQEDHVSMGSISARHARTVLAARRADPRDRAAGRGAGARPAAGRHPIGGGARGRCGGGARRIRARVRTSTATVSPGPTWRRRPRSSTTARSPTSPAEARRRAPAPMGAITILDVTDPTGFGRVPPCADPGSTIARATTGRTPIAGRRRPARLARSRSPAAAGGSAAAPRQPVPRRSRGEGAGRQSVRHRRPRTRS